MIEEKNRLEPALKDLVEKCNSKRTPTWSLLYIAAEIVENVID
jgi:hypothetical protein